MNNHFDIIVIGGGVAGYTAASQAAQAGLRVLLVEKDELGGCCLNRGCMPMKRLLSDVSAGDSFAWEVFQVDCEEMVQSMREGIHLVLSSRNVEIMHGEAMVSNPHTVVIDGREVSATSIILAVGATPRYPDCFPKGEGIYTSDTIWKMEKLPERLLILGGGVIGLEMASAFSRVGVQVTVVEKESVICREYERAVLQPVLKKLKRDGVRIWTNEEICEMIELNSAKAFRWVARFANHEEESFSAVLFAMGRQTNMEVIRNMNPGPEICQGKVQIDGVGQTSIPGLYCIGDANGKRMNAQYAMWQAQVAVGDILGKIQSSSRKNAIDTMPVLPECIYTDPPVAKIGWNREEMEAAGYSFREGSVSYQNIPMARALRQTSGRMKVWRDTETDMLLGVQISGKEAHELIHILQPYIQNRIPCRQVLQQIFAHPSLAEGLRMAIEESYEEGSCQLIKK